MKIQKIKQCSAEELDMIGLLDRYRVYAPDNRCWFTCIDLLRKMPKKLRKEFVFVEGKAIFNSCYGGEGITHYWLQKGDEVYDCHYEIIGENVKEYKVEKVWTAEDIVSKINKESYEEKPGYDVNGKEKWMKVYSLDLEEKNK